MMARFTLYDAIGPQQDWTRWKNKNNMQHITNLRILHISEKLHLLGVSAYWTFTFNVASSRLTTARLRVHSSDAPLSLSACQPVSTKSGREPPSFFVNTAIARCAVPISCTVIKAQCANALQVIGRQRLPLGKEGLDCIYRGKKTAFVLAANCEIIASCFSLAIQ